MRMALLLGAASLVIVTNGWSVWQATRNRAQAHGGTFQLTEREVPLQSVALESSVTVLRLNWRTAGSDSEQWRGSPAWLDSNKLVDLGFDFSVPLSSPEARRHYRSTPPRRVFLALTYQAASPDHVGTSDRTTSGLVVVDAVASPQQLRERYPDPQEHVICSGLVRLRFRTHERDGELLSTPRLEAWIEGPRPSEVSVPKPTNRLLVALHRTVTEEKNTPATEPRFTARVRCGKHYEPWVDDVQPLNK